MTDRCGRCGHGFSDPGSYYGADFARYFSRSPAFLLSWCYQCSHVSLSEQPRYLGLLRAPVLKLKKAVPSSAMTDLPQAQMKDEELGVFAGAHLLRMTWHCFSERTNAKDGSANPEAALDLALQKLAPREAALMIMMTVSARMLIPLEQQLQEGAYLKDSIPLATFKQWLATSPHQKAAAGTLEMLKGYPDAE